MGWCLVRTEGYGWSLNGGVCFVCGFTSFENFGGQKTSGQFSVIMDGIWLFETFLHGPKLFQNLIAFLP
ncbi:hypothetical protein L596_022013 [Steinernema carpocapsae]|uniref:Uncharacterized protein n=1 Tax=Steinernema carpocapsae TaxID=34508 RepID=A0A4V6A039_STECR|nr:hypothetical protein L596_022013 [Steinernema carpocapsae]